MSYFGVSAVFTEDTKIAINSSASLGKVTIKCLRDNPAFRKEFKPIGRLFQLLRTAFDFTDEFGSRSGSRSLSILSSY